MDGGRVSRATLLATVSYLAVAVMAPRLALAEVRTDGTLGRRVRLQGGDITIGAGLGQQRGGNLFHSFEKFDVETGGKVTFTGPGSVKNVISRVTGGQPSSIDGTLASIIPDADLYLINPAGIMFGPDARLDVKGSFHASTAGELRLADGAVFSALDAAGSTLSVADPKAFGFIGASPGTITVDQSILTVGQEKSLSLIAEAIVFEVGDTGLLGAVDGTIALTATSTFGEVDVTASVVKGDLGGNISIRRLPDPYTKTAILADGYGDAKIKVTADSIEIKNVGIISNGQGLDSGGTIEITSGDLSIDGSNLYAGGNITLNSIQTNITNFSRVTTSGRIKISGADMELSYRSYLRSRLALGPGNNSVEIIMSGAFDMDYSNIVDFLPSSDAPDAGNIFIQAKSINIDAGYISTYGTYFGSSAGGSIIMNAEDITLSHTTLEAITTGDGKGGSIIIDTNGQQENNNSVRIVNDSRIKAGTEGYYGGGDGGVINIHTSLFEAEGQGTVISSSSDGSAGDAGSVTISAENIRLSNGAQINSQAIPNSFGNYRGSPGNAGSVSVDANIITMLSGASISASTEGPGYAGSVSVTGGRLVLEDSTISSNTIGAGAAGSVTVDLQEALRLAGGGITTSSSGAGAAGDVLVTAPDIELVGVAVTAPAIGSQALGSGAAGTVTVGTAPNGVLEGRLSLLDGASINTSTLGAAPGGSVSIMTGALTAIGASEIASNSSGDGDAGSVRVTALAVDLTGASGITSRAQSTGTAGAVTVSAADLVVGDSAFIDADTVGSGAGGAVAVNGTRITLRDGGRVGSGTFADGDAGNVTVVARESLDLVAGSVDTSSLGAGRAGNVLIEAPILTVDQGSIRSSSDGTGAAGSVLVWTAPEGALAGSVFLRDGSIDTSATGGGAGGDVRLSTGHLTGSGTSFIASNTFADGDAGSVEVEAMTVSLGDRSRIASDSFQGAGAAGAVSVSAPVIALAGDATISAGTDASGQGGTVAVTGARLTLADRSGISSGTDGGGAAGDVSVRMSEAVSLAGGRIATDSSADGIAGNLTVASPTVTLAGGRVTSTARGAGSAGTVRVDAQSVALDGTGLISSSAEAGATGAAGAVTVDAADVAVRGGASISASTAGSGQGGTVTVTGARLALSSQGSVSSGTTSSGAAGDVTVAMRESVRVAGGTISTNGEADGAAGNVTVTAPLVALTGGSISSSATGSGAAGTVQVLTSGGGGAVAAAAATAPTGRVALSGGAAITTSALGDGRAGSVTIGTGDLSVLDGNSRISSSTAGADAAGDVRIVAGNSVMVDGATIESSSTGTGAGGDVNIDSPKAVVTLKGGGTLAAMAEAGSGAGNIEIAARELNAKDGIVSTEGGATAGGRITVAARERIYLRDTAITSSGAVAGDGASVISLTAPQLILSRSQVESLTGDGQTLAGSGEAELTGQITVISADTIVAGSSSVVISGLQTNLGSDLQISPNVFLDATSLLQPGCAERGPARSTFSRGGRGGLPPAPDRPLPSAGAEPPAAVRATEAGAIFLDVCAGSLMPETKS